MLPDINKFFVDFGRAYMDMIICFRCSRRVRKARQTITFMALARFAFEIFRLAHVYEGQCGIDGLQ